MSSAAPEASTELVWRNRAHIFFHDDVNADSSAKFIKCVSEFVNENKDIANSLSPSAHSRPSLFVHINSSGGCAFSGLMLYDFMNTLRDTIFLHTFAEGLCASAATFIFLAGEARTVRPFAHVLIHQIRSSAAFVYQTLTNEKEELRCRERVQGSVRRLYELNTTIPRKKLDELFTTEQYLDASECEQYGLFNTVSNGQTLGRALKRKR
jgi:ATP-dependent protease ClpP protease subunit